MFDSTKAFSSYSVDDVERAKQFYGETLGLPVADGEMGILALSVGGGREVMIYPKGEAHEPASFTVLNFSVDDIDAAVDELTGRGVEFERYEGTELETDAKGINRGEGPLIAWFKDPAGNVLAVIEGA